jgi:hypothetical protein
MNTPEQEESWEEEFEALIRHFGWHVNAHAVFNASGTTRCCNGQCTEATDYEKTKSAFKAFISRQIAEAERRTEERIVNVIKDQQTKGRSALQFQSALLTSLHQDAPIETQE